MIDSSSKAEMPAKLDWSKPIRRTDKEFSDATGFRVLATDLEGEFPVVVTVLGYGRPLTLHYRKDGSYSGNFSPVWENVPDEEWVYTFSEKEFPKKYVYGIFSSKEETIIRAKRVAQTFHTNIKIVRLSDGYTENID